VIERERSPQSCTLPADTTLRVSPCGDVSHTRTMRSGSAYGSGASRTECTRLKIAVVAPMPIASVSTAIAVNDGARSSERAP
jgi:hypothetical protein